MAMYIPVNKSQLIREALLRRYPCAEIPTGTLATMAAEFGVTRELVRQIARKLNISRVNVSRPTTVCTCGKVMTPGSTELCLDCRWVELPCGWCGKPKKVSARLLAWHVARGKTVNAPNGKKVGYSGAVYCDRLCFGKYVGREYGRGAQRAKAGLRPASEYEHGTTSRYGSGCRCDPCRAAHNAQRQKAARAV